MEHDVLGDPEEFEAMMAQAQAEARAESKLEAEASAGEIMPQEQEQEDLSHVPEEILEEMDKLPEEGAAALLDAYKQRVALRRELESQVRKNSFEFHRFKRLSLFSLIDAVWLCVCSPDRCLRSVCTT
jgi:hypothetical protein